MGIPYRYSTSVCIVYDVICGTYSISIFCVCVIVVVVVVVCVCKSAERKGDWWRRSAWRCNTTGADAAAGVYVIVVSVWNEEVRRWCM